VPDDPFRLPRTVTPSSYELRLEPDLEAATFAGTCRAAITVNEPIHEIVCNAIELDIETATIETPTGGVVSCGVGYDEVHERLILTPSQPLSPGRHLLATEFTGILNDKLRGFYRSSFVDADGTEHTLATSQLESTNARRAFPCWDEPDLKATFEITLVTPADLLAVSCGAEVASSVLPDGRREVRFAPTMVMSTYLLAFVVGPLQATEPVDVNGTPLRVIHPIGKGHLVDFALEVGEFALRHFEDYFAIPYPGDKLDLLAIPDFAFGAMENVGAVTFREILLLLDPATATQPERQRCADVIAHELAHMWFGDLVTMKWWEGVWLKEAFATFMEMHATDAWRPDWERWVDFGLSRSAAFDVDALAETRAIEFPVTSPADAEGMYDLLTYEKGAAVVRMLEQYLGEDSFRDGVRHYLRRHSYGTTDTTDLWDALEETSGQPIRRVMDSWIFQGGHPIITVDTVDSSSIRLSQQRFRYDDATDDTRWGVPIVLRVFAEGASTTVPVLLEATEMTVEIGPNDAVLVNADASGFYRVRYDQKSGERLLSLPAGSIAPIERYGLVDDAWAAVVANKMDAGDYLRFISEFVGSNDVSVWSRIISTLSAVKHHLGDDQLAAYGGWVADLLQPVLDRLGTVSAAGDDDRTRELRAAVFGALGRISDDPGVVARSRELLDDDAADPSMRAAAIGVVAGVADRDTFDDLVQRFRSAATPQDERRYSFALALVPGAAEFDNLLAMTIDGTIRTQDAPYLIGRALGHREHGAAAWGFVEREWDEVNRLFPTNSIVRMLDGIRALADPDAAAAVMAFFADHTVEQGEKTLAQHLERLAVNVGVRARVRAQVPAAIG